MVDGTASKIIHTWYGTALALPSTASTKLCARRGMMCFEMD